MEYAYIRATNGKEFDEQVAILNEYGTKAWESETQGGYLGNVTFNNILSKIIANDTIVVSFLNVFPFSTMKLVEFVSDCYEKKINLKILKGDIHIPTLVLLRNHAKSLKQVNAKESIRLSGGGRKKGSLSSKEKEMAKASAYMYEVKYKKNLCSLNDILKECGYQQTDKPKLYRHLEIMGIKLKSYQTEEETFSTPPSEVIPEYKLKK